MLKCKIILFFIHFSFLLALTSCLQKHKKPVEIIVNKPELINYEVRQIIQNQLEQYRADSLLIIDEDTIITAEWIYALFSENNFEPFWTSENKLLPFSDSLIKIIKSSEYYGLNSDDYYSQIISNKIKLFTDPLDYKISVTRIYEINILLSDAFYRFIVHLNKGRLNPKTLTREWKGDEIETNMTLVLNHAFIFNNINKTIESFEPKLMVYKQLKNLLSLLLDSAKSDSSEMKIKTIKMNMERIRWEQEMTEDYYISINIPSYTFRLIECDTISLLSRVIVGKPETPTFHFIDSKIKYFFVYPYWFVPFSIASKEILPILKKDTSYLREHNMDVMDNKGTIINSSTIKWKLYSENHFPFTIRQRDGDENTLGVLKFIFSNNYGIYLHDTNSKNLFENDFRAFSHGCIRLEKAKELARAISYCCVSNFNTDSLEKYVLNKERKKVMLFNPLPIHIRYYTVELEGNNINFYDDIYLIDEKMNAELKYILELTHKHND